MIEESSLGESGTRVAKLLVGLLTSRGGIWRERPRTGKFGLLGVVGEIKALSSLTVRAGSRKAGEGERVGFGASDNDRGFEGDDFGRDGVMIPVEEGGSRFSFEVRSILSGNCCEI